MSVILAQWLQNDVGLSRRVSPTDLDSAFASGFLFAEVLFRLNKVSPADFAAFENCNALNLEAAVANFSKIELVLRESLNVKLSPNTAFDLISGKKGGAARLLYQIKAASGNAPSQKDKEIIALPPLPHLRDNKPAFESYPTSPLPGSPHPPLSANVTSSPRRKYDEKEHDFFAETLRLKLRRVHHAGYRPLDHPRLDHPEVDYEKLLERKRREQQEKLDLLERENEKKPPKVAEACEPVSQTKKALPPRKVIKELTKTEHAYSMREQAKLDKKREAIELRDKRIVQNLLQNLDQFEKNLHMDEKPMDEETVVEAKEEETAALDPEDIKAFVSKRASLDPIQHSKELSRQMPPQEEEAKKTEEYVDKIRERKLEEDVSRKEREQRRRKIVLGHQQAKEEMEKSHLEELLLTKLMRQSKQERRIAEGLMQIRLEKDFMCENRMHREEQYAKRRQKDYEEALEREFILAEKAREEYKKQTELQLAQHFEILAIKAGEKYIKHAEDCKEIVHQIIDLSFKIAEYRELNDYDDAPPNPNMLRQWKILFIKGQPLLRGYNLHLEQDKIKDLTHLPNSSVTQEVTSKEVTAEPEIVEGIQMIDEEEFKHYLDGTGLWSTTSNVIKNGPLKNEHLGLMIKTIFEIVTPPDNGKDKPKLPTVPLRMILLGKRFAGKKTVAKQIAEYYELAFLTVEGLTKDAISEVEAIESTITDAKQKKAATANLIGTKLQQAMTVGNGPDDEVLVTLVMDAIKKHSSEESRGWVLVDFPRNRYQAQLLEKELSGYEDPKPVKPGTLKRTPTSKEKEKEKPVPMKKKSLIAPTDERGEAKGPVPVSGVDAVFLLEIDNEMAVKRATGRRLDPLTGIEYHLETNPPPLNQPGIHERLVPVDDDGCQDTQLQYQIALFEEQEDLLKEWFSRFNNLHIIDSMAPQEETHNAVKEIVHELADKKEQEKQQRLKELAAAEPLPTVKTPAPPSPPVVEEPPKEAPAPAPPAANPPEVKKEDEKKGKVGSGKNRSGSAKQSAEKPTSRGTSALKPAEPAKPRANMIGIPDRSGGSAAVIYVEAPDASLPPLVRTAAPDGRKLPTKELAEIMSDQWVTIEKTYTETIKFAFRCLRREREAIMKYRHKTKVDFRKFLERPDKKQELLELFQKEFNAIEDDLRPDPDAKAELHQRAEDLREKLWDMSDKRRDEADVERITIIDDKYIEDHFAIVSNIFATIMQAEVDKFLGAKQLALDYYKDAYVSTVLGEYPKGHIKVPQISPNSVPPVDTSVVVEALHKRRETLSTSIARPKAVSAAIATSKKISGSASRIKFTGIDNNNGIPDPDPSMFSDLEAAIAVALSAITATKPVHEEPPAPEKDKKDKKKAAAVVEAVPEPKAEPESELPSEYQMLVDMEDKILQTRMEKIRLMATMTLTEIRNIGIDLYSYLDEIIGTRFQAEMESIRDLLYSIKEAIEAEVRLPNEFMLVGEKFRVDFNCLTYEPEPEPRPESPTEKLISDQFTVVQLLNLGKHFKGLAPSGFLTIKEFVENFQRLATVSPGTDILPEVYLNADAAMLQQVATALDPCDTGFVNWRRFILTQARILPVPTLEQLINLKDSYACADSYVNGKISKADFMSIPLWFEEEQDDIQTVTEENPVPKFNRPAKLKAALFEFFSTTQAHDASVEQLTQSLSQSTRLLPVDEQLDENTSASQDVLSQEVLATEVAPAIDEVNKPVIDGDEMVVEEQAVPGTTVTEAEEEKNLEPAEELFDVKLFLMGCVLDESARIGLQKAFFIVSDRGDGGVNLDQLYEIFHFPLVLVDETNRLGTEQSEDPIPMDSLARVFEDAGLAPTDYIMFDQFCSNLDGHTLLNYPHFILDDNLLATQRARLEKR